MDEKQIIAVNLEDLEFENLKNYRELYSYISTRMLPNKMNYVFLDEIQSVDMFQKAIDSLFLKENVDIYLTGSNAYLLSGEISTLLSGRYIEIELRCFRFPLENTKQPPMHEGNNCTVTILVPRRFPIPSTFLRGSTCVNICRASTAQ